MERNKKIDFIRAFAIISVIIWHSIQFGSGPLYYSGKCLEAPIFKSIYSFHMPLFMLLSGYLFYCTLEYGTVLVDGSYISENAIEYLLDYKQYVEGRGED